MRNFEISKFGNIFKKLKMKKKCWSEGPLQETHPHRHPMPAHRQKRLLYFCFSNIFSFAFQLFWHCHRNSSRTLCHYEYPCKPFHCHRLSAKVETLTKTKRKKERVRIHPYFPVFVTILWRRCNAGTLKVFLVILDESILFLNYLETLSSPRSSFESDIFTWNLFLFLRLRQPTQKQIFFTQSNILKLTSRYGYFSTQKCFIQMWVPISFLKTESWSCHSLCWS